MGMGISQWEWEGMGILIVFPHTSALCCLVCNKADDYFPVEMNSSHRACFISP